MLDIEMNLTSLVEARQKLLDEMDSIWDFYYTEDPNEKNPETSLKTIEEAEAKYESDKHVLNLKSRSDLLRLEVLDYVYKYHESLSFESVIEAMTSTGAAPSLLYDDNGYFAVEEEGIQGVQLDGDKFEEFGGTWSTKKESWHRTVRDALNYYLDNFFDGWDLEAAKKDL